MIIRCLIRGAAIGLVCGVPIGAIGILTLQRTIDLGPRCGLASGMSSAFVDLLYGFAAVYGLSMVSDFIFKWELPIRIGGCALVFAYGVFMLLKKHTPDVVNRSPAKNGLSPLACFLTTLPIALSNPVTIVAFSVGLAGSGLEIADLGHAACTSAGIFLGGSVWWILLVFLFDRLRSRIGGQVRLWLDRIAGFLMIGIGILIVLNTAAKFLF